MDKERGGGAHENPYSSLNCVYQPKTGSIGKREGPGERNTTRSGLTAP